ncbi:MAG TPA: endolytic transglycosylase MltG, partial [Candidatus Binatus sp.]|nr:endolytic transglycosylase MltG [Candidatus Binatus sp.]
GDSLATVSRKLREQKIITNGLFFSLWARLSGVEKRLHQGLYRFDTGVPPKEVLERLVSGKGIFQSVTIAEGLTVREIAALLAKLQIADKDKFLIEAANPALLKILGLQDKGLEGYLFPSTYNFTPGTPEKEIITTMAEQFRKTSQPILTQGGENLKMSNHEILTLASIIEKETGVEEERPLVAAVFHNRLKQHMPLQSDPTVIYGIKDFNGNLTRKDLQEDSPYNTYRIAALPPGPICNPSVSSIKAALHPADVPFLYFVSKNDGTHTFSETIEAHNRAVKTYQPVRQAPHASAPLATRQR